MKKALHPSLWVALLFLLIMSCVFLIRNFAHSPKESISTPLPTETSIRKININTADNDELQQIPGIGPVTAADIIAYRDANGPFTDPSQLLYIDGIGQKKFLLLLEYIYWEE